MKPVLDKFLRPTDSPVSRNKGRMTGIEFDRKFEVQSQRIKSSSMSIQSFIKESDTDTATASWTTGDSLTITATLDPDNVNKTAIPLGIPQISVYQGTATTDAFQIYPKSGGSIDPANYDFDFGFDWGSALSDGSDIVAMLSMENVGAGSVDLIAKVKWKYIADRDGAFTAA
jgi:hypothetical protein